MRRSKTKESSSTSSLVELVMIVVVALALALGIQAFLVKPYRIPSESMVPTLEVGQRVLVNRIGARFSDPDVGDIVVFHPPAGAEQGNQCGGGDGCNYPKPITIPADHYFMMGDNRGSSDDSRFWGPVPREWIIGGAFGTYWPPNRIGLF